MSAPHSSGRIRYGVGTVLSTISGMPLAWATPATPSMSNTSFFGFGIVSPKNTLVFGWIAASHWARSCGVVDERDLDAELRQRVVQQVVRAAVQRRRRDDVVAGLAQRHEGERLGGLAGGDGERAGQADRRGAAALERVDASLERRLRRVHDAGVDVADLGRARTGSRRGRCRGTGTTSSGRSAPPGRRSSGRARRRRGSAWSRIPSCRS